MHIIYIRNSSDYLQLDFLSEFSDICSSGYAFDLNKEEYFHSFVDNLYNDRVKLLKM